jgi:hypothetical protein
MAKVTAKDAKEAVMLTMDQACRIHGLPPYTALVESLVHAMEHIHDDPGCEECKDARRRLRNLP